MNRNDLENRLADLNLGYFEETDDLTDTELESMIDELDTDIDLETEEGINKLSEIAHKYVKPHGTVILKYEGVSVGSIVTNQSLTLDEALDLVGIDIYDMQDANDTVWDYELFELDYK